MVEPTLATCTTLLAPLDQTLQFVRYHLASGVDRMYLFFDNPGDPAIPELSGDPRIVCIRCDAEHWKSFSPQTRDQLSLNTIQRMNSTQAIQFARRDGIRWLAHIDSDEWIYCPGKIKDRIAVVPTQAQVIKLASMEYVPSEQEQSPGLENDPSFKKWYPTRPGVKQNRQAFNLSGTQILKLAWNKSLFAAKIKIAKALGCSQPFAYGYLKGHISGKSITRTDSPVSALDCHYPIVSEPVNLWLFSGLAVLHYDAPGYEAWKQKWIARYAGSAKISAEKELRAERLKQYQKFVELYSKGAEEELRALYAKLYLLNGQERIVLERLGLLTRVQFPERIFPV